jgi:hypothetical protein
MDGPSDSYLPDMKSYAWQPGDTFRGIANTYYGEGSMLALLRRASEDRKSVQPGEKILVPMFDLDAPSGAPLAKGAVAPKNALAPKNEEAVVDSNAKMASKSASVSASSGCKTHVVNEGESLWWSRRPSSATARSGRRSTRPTHDVMQSPEALKTQVKLESP